MDKKETGEAKVRVDELKAEFITNLLKAEAEKNWTLLQGSLVPRIKAKTENVHKLRTRLQEMLTEAANIQVELQGDQTIIKELTEVLWSESTKGKPAEPDITKKAKKPKNKTKAKGDKKK